MGATRKTTGPFAVKDHSRAGRGHPGRRRRGRPQAGRRRARPDRARHRRRHRYRHLRGHRRRHRRCGPGGDPVVRPGGVDVRVLGALLRGAGVVDPGLRQRLHLRLRDARRARGVDHRLGPDPRVRRRPWRPSPWAGAATSTSSSRTRSGSRCRNRSRTRPRTAARSTCRPCAIVAAVTFLLVARRAGDGEGELLHGRLQAADPAVLHRRRRSRRVQHGQPEAVRAQRRRRRR